MAPLLSSQDPLHIDLAALLRSGGFAALEKARPAEIRAALAKLSQRFPEVASLLAKHPSSDSFLTAQAASMTAPKTSPLPANWEQLDDPYALPRFFEPKPFLPEGDRTFLRLIAIDARRLFCTWDLSADVHQHIDGAVELHLYQRDWLGVPPRLEEIVQSAPCQVLEVDVAARSWYLPTPAARVAVVVRLVVRNTHQQIRVLSTSNVALIPADGPAPAGPRWFATLPPKVSRRALAQSDALEQALYHDEAQATLPEGASISTLPSDVPTPAVLSPEAMQELARLLGLPPPSLHPLHSSSLAVPPVQERS